MSESHVNPRLDGGTPRSVRGSVSGPDRLSTPRTPSRMKTTQTPRQMTLWMYTNPNTLYMLPTEKGSSPINKLDQFIQSKGLGSDSYSVASLIPNASYPVPIMHFSSDLDSGILLCLPTRKLSLIIIDPRQHNGSFTTHISPLQTIRDLKHVIAKLKGYPSSRQELIYNNMTLQNDSQILDHQLSSGNKIQLSLQPAWLFTVIVDTFWGERYYLDVDSCMTTDQLILKILSQTCNPRLAQEEMESKLLSLPDLCQLEHGERMLEFGVCLNYYSIGGGSVMRLRATSELRHDDTRKLKVIEGEEELMIASGASYDIWLIIALQAHGKLHVPINKFNLYVNEYRTDLYGLLSDVQLPDNYIHVRVIPEKTKVHYDPHDIHIIEVKLPTGRTHSVECQGQDHISKIKDSIQQSGLPNVHFYELTYKKLRLPPTSKILDYKFPECVDMELRLFMFPVHVSQGNTTTTVSVDMACPVPELIKQISHKIGCTSIKSALVHSGTDLYSISKSSLPRHVGLFINSTIYLEPVQVRDVIHVVRESQVLLLPTRYILDPLSHKQLLNTCHDTPAFLQAYHWFIKWRFSDKSQLPGDRKRYHRRYNKLSTSQSLHSMLQAARDELKPSNNVTASPPDTSTASPSGADQLLSKFLSSLPTVQYSPRRRREKLPTISHSSRATRRNRANRSPSTPRKSTSQPSGQATSKPPGHTTARQEANRRKTTENRDNLTNKRSVRFDIPEEAQTRRHMGEPSHTLARSNTLWQDSNQYLQKQAKQTSSRQRSSPHQYNNNGGSSPAESGSVTAPGMRKNTQANHQPFPIPKWHQSQAHMNPNFTDSMSLKGSTLSAISMKPAAQPTST